MHAARDRKRVQNEVNQAEVRLHPRVLLNLPIEYLVNNKVPRVGYTFNVSPGGVMVNVPEKLGKGQLINLAIFFSLGSTLEAIKVSSQVVWVDDTKKDGSYRSGIKFIDLSAKDKSKLQKFFEKY